MPDDLALNDVLERALDDPKSYRDPAEIIAEVVADVRDREGKVMIGRATRKKAQRVLEALRAEGWRVLR